VRVAAVSALHSVMVWGRMCAWDVADEGEGMLGGWC
jgi:hypothetical protein